jgi:hypothetical protein
MQSTMAVKGIFITLVLLLVTGYWSSHPCPVKCNSSTYTSVSPSEHCLKMFGKLSFKSQPDCFKLSLRFGFDQDDRDRATPSPR